MATIRHVSEALWERKSQLAGHSPQHTPTFRSLLGENQAKPPLYLHTSVNSFGEDGEFINMGVDSCAGSEICLCKTK